MDGFVCGADATLRKDKMRFLLVEDRAKLNEELLNVCREFANSISYASNVAAAEKMITARDFDVVVWNLDSSYATAVGIMEKARQKFRSAFLVVVSNDQERRRAADDLGWQAVSYPDAAEFLRRELSKL